MIPQTTAAIRTPPPGARVVRKISGENVWQETRVTATGSRESAFRVERDQQVEMTVLAAHNSVIDRATVAYPIATWGGRPLELADKTYLLEVSPSGVVVSMLGGGAAPGGESRRVLDEHPDFGQSDRIIEAISAAPLRVGADQPALGAVVLSWLWSLGSLRDMGNADSFKVRVKLSSVRKTNAVEEAVFDVALDTAKPAAGWADPSEKLRGTLVVRKHEGWPVAFDIEGPYKAGFVTMEGKLLKEGRRKLSITWSYTLTAP